MGRHRKNQSNKSTGKNEIKEVWPNAWVKMEQKSSKGYRALTMPCTPHVVFQDALQLVKDMMHGHVHIAASKRKRENGLQEDDIPLEEVESLPKFSDVVSAMKVYLQEMLELSYVNTVVMCFDKHDHVATAKGQLQSNRDAKNIPIENLPPLVLDLDANVPKEWDDYLGDRAKTRKYIIAFICYHLLQADGPYKMQLRHDARFVIDGHCLSHEQMTELGVDMPMFSEEQNRRIEIVGIDAVLEDVPLVASLCNGQRRIVADARLTNTNGEADFLPFFYINIITQNYESPCVALILSTDSDYLYYGLMAIDKATLRKAKNVPRIWLMPSKLISRFVNVVNLKN